MKLSEIIKLIGCILLPLAIGGLSAYFSGTSMSEWFTSLNKPSFNPPAYLFAPVWTTLYILMGISFFLILQTPASPTRRKAIIIFSAQLFFNFWWSLLFFAFHLLIISVIEIILLWLLIFYMIKIFRQVKPVAGYLQIPYLLWVSFATILNFSIMWLNQ